MHFDVCLTPELLRITELKGKIVVVADILRATSTMVAGLANGVSSITPVATIDECLNLERTFNTLISGERNGDKLEGFDLGNSPFEFMSVENKNIVMTTTNGTLAIEMSKSADMILIGAFLNLNAVAQEIKKMGKDVVVVCAGWKGNFNLEDTIFAGALFASLKANDVTFSDATLAAFYLHLQAQNDMVEFMKNSSHFRRLEHKNLTNDINFCFSKNIFDIVPYFDGQKLVPLEKVAENIDV